jgi:hypothetical protein
MTVSTVTVSIAVSQITGVALPAGRVRFELTAADIDGAIVAPASTNVVLDASGNATAALWPNALGTQSTQYRVTISNSSGELQYNGLATIPNANCNLHDVLNVPAPGAITSLAAGFVTVTPPAGYVSTNQQAMDQELATVIANIVAGATTWGTITGTLASQTDLSTALAGKVPTTRTVAGHALSADITLVKADVGLGSVDDTADSAKPVSTAQAASDASVLSTAQAYADSLVTAILDDRGGFDASGNAFPSTGGRGAAGAILKGDLWTISVGGTLGGQVVGVGDVVRSLANSPGQTAGNWTITEHNFGYVAENSANKNASGGYAGLTLFKLNLVNALGTITSWFTTAATVARTWTMPDKDGTVAMTSDISAAAIAAIDHAAAAKTVLVDGDEVNGTDSASSFGLIRTVWSDVWTYISSKAASVYAALGSANLFTKAQRGAIVTLTDATTVALDLSLGNQYALVLGGSRTLGAPTNTVTGQQGTISVRQDATGSRTLAYAWPYEWFGGSAGVLSTAGCTRDLLGYSVDAYGSAVVTITIAAPGVVTMTAHGASTGQRCQITTTGALPTGLTASTSYWISVVDANSFKLCTSLANAAAGTFITTTGSQSGVHTLTYSSITLNLSKAAA